MSEHDASDPRRNGWPTQQLTLTPGAGASAGGVIRVFGARVFLSHALPRDGSLVIGRAVGCDIQVDDDSVSRNHAVLRFAEEITIEDLGSSNGTRVGGVELKRGEQRPLPSGQLAELGAVLVTVVRDGPTAARQLWERASVAAWIEHACAAGQPFAIARIRIVSDIATEIAEVALLQALGASDLLSRAAPDQYDVVLVNTDDDATRAWLRVIATLLHRIEGNAQVAVARFGVHGQTPAALEAHLVATLDGRPDASQGGAQVVVVDEAMLAIHRMIARIAGSDITVLLTGETGVGKEVLAEKIHHASPRRDRPLLRLNCAALSEPLLESELFGHERGAFTGATHAKPGLFEVAAGGTVMLDEIGEMSLAIQAKLLRVLDERKVWPVGGLKPRPIDVRFIAATNRDLEREVAEHRFRQDLYFRLRGVLLVVPPLRERRREIVALTRVFVQRAAAVLRVAAPELTPEAEDAVERHLWPGNVRELKSVVERAVLLAGDTIGPAELGLEPPRASRSSAQLDVDEDTLADEIATIERDRILAMLERCGGNQSEAARRLQMSRSKLIARLDRYGVSRPRKPG